MKYLYMSIYLAIGIVNASFANLWWYERFYPFYAAERDLDLIAINVFLWPFTVAPNLSNGIYSCGFLIPFAEYDQSKVTTCRMVPERKTR